MYGERQRDGRLRGEGGRECERACCSGGREDAMLVARGTVPMMGARARGVAVLSAGAVPSAMMMMGVRILLRAREELRREAIGADLETERPVGRRHESGGNERARDQREKQRADEPLA